MKYFTKSELAIGIQWVKLWNKIDPLKDGLSYVIGNWEIEEIAKVAARNDPINVIRNMESAIKTGCPSLKYYLNDPMKKDWRPPEVIQAEIDKVRAEKSEKEYQKLKKEVEDRPYGKPN